MIIFSDSFGFRPKLAADFFLTNTKWGELGQQARLDGMWISTATEIIMLN